MSILDRYLASPAGAALCLNSRTQFQLAAMTCLYTAVKVHEPEVMSAELVSNLSRGAHSAKEVEAMETHILSAVGWLVNPPTALSFVRDFLRLLPAGVLGHDDETASATLFEISRFQTELAIADETMISIPASTVAYASLMNALEAQCQDKHVLGYASTILAEAGKINRQSHHFHHVQSRLCSAVTKNTTPSVAMNVATSPVAICVNNNNESSSVGAKRRSSYHTSPTTITRMEV